jgi:hypothetical protein
MKTYTRKEIANANSVSSNTVKRRERELGLSDCKDAACRKPIRYHSKQAQENLERKGWRSP